MLMLPSLERLFLAEKFSQQGSLLMLACKLTLQGRGWGKERTHNHGESSSGCGSSSRWQDAANANEWARLKLRLKSCPNTRNIKTISATLYEMVRIHEITNRWNDIVSIWLPCPTCKVKPFILIKFIICYMLSQWQGNNWRKNKIFGRRPFPILLHYAHDPQY